MKDIQKTKLWPILKENGFAIKEHRIGSRCFGRGAILLDAPTNTSIEVKPLFDGRWYMCLNLIAVAKIETGTTGQLAKKLPEYLTEYTNQTKTTL